MRQAPPPPLDAASVQRHVSSGIPKILDQAQNTMANHQKNLVALYKVHTAAAAYCVTSKKKGKDKPKRIGEAIFRDILLQLIARAFPVKKSAQSASADRIIKFVAAYIKFIHEKAAEQNSDEEDEEENDELLIAARLTNSLLDFCRQGFRSKDKSVRYRVLQLVGEMVENLGEINEDTYDDLREELSERVTDKDPGVRVQAATALCKHCRPEFSSNPSEDRPPVVDTMIDILERDSSAEVRRAVLNTIPVTSDTLPHILDRTRDTDTTIRKTVYEVLRRDITIKDTDEMGPTHPRALSISQRELIIRNGLGDRESTVKKEAEALLIRWLEVVTDLQPKHEGDEPIESGLLALLGLLDLSVDVAADIVLKVFDKRPDIFDNVEFNNGYWSSLTPEKVFLARIFAEHCKSKGEDARRDAALPVVTALAFRIQEAYNGLISVIGLKEEEQLVFDLNEEERIRMDDEAIEGEFVIGEMLRLAVNLDYADEIGRRKMFQLVRDMLSQDGLPESFLCKCLDVLRDLSASERDLIRVVVEIIQELRDPGGEDDQENGNDEEETNEGETPSTVRRPKINKLSVEKTPEEQARATAIEMRCLILCIGMLERVDSKLEDNSTLLGVLQDLIFPSVKSEDLAFRKKGFVSFGLICLIDRRIAIRSLSIFFKHIDGSPEELKLIILRAIFDMLMVHKHDLLGGDIGVNVIERLTELMCKERLPKVQALLSVGMSKLVLSRIITNVQVVQNLVMTYLSPNTMGNSELQQCLTFSLLTYSHSSPINQRNMREMFIETYVALSKIREDLDEDEEMISAAQIGALFVDWTDPVKLRNALEAGKNMSSVFKADDSIHLDLANDIFMTLLGIKRTSQDSSKKVEIQNKDDIKVLCQLLLKLYIPEKVDDYQIKVLKLLMNKLRSHRPFRDTVTKNAFTKFETLISQKFESQLEGLDEEDLRKLENLTELFAYLDDMIPLDEDDTASINHGKSEKRRSDSIVTSAESEEFGRSRSTSKRPRLSTSDNSDNESANKKPVVPRSRVLPKRAAASKKPQVIEISSDSGEEMTPLPRQKRPRAQVKEEPASVGLNEGNSTRNNQSVEVSFDSIMDDSEDEEDEVNNNLLASD